jgi:DNA mismatch endonuclease (patch repair protein)
VVDKLTPERRSENMRRIKSTNTGPELVVRRMLHRLGYRFRLHGLGLPGKPDLVFAPKRRVTFVHGCFWHQHLDCNDGRKPRSNAGYWDAKLSKNVERDQMARLALERMGWKIATVWECDLADLTNLEARLRIFLEEESTPLRPASDQAPAGHAV